MVESIQNRIYHRLNQLQIELTIDRINYRLNLPMVASTYGCRESQKSKKVKVESQRRSKPTKVQDFTTLKSRDPVGFQGLSALTHSTTSLWARIRACELEAGSWSWNRSTAAT